MLDRFIKSLIVCGIGLVTVFVILIVIILVIKLIEYINKVDYSKFGAKIKQKFNKNKKDENEIDSKTVAVITAAIACILSEERKAADPDNQVNNVPFKVRNIKSLK